MSKTPAPKPFALIVGIDPGQTGAMAFITFTASNPRPWRLLSIYDFTDGDTLTSAALSAYKGKHGNLAAVVELVHSRPSDGVASAFTFGERYGFINGLLIANAIEAHHTPPSVWKTLLGLSGKDKHHSIDLALSLYGPDAATFINKKSHHNRAEALLLAHFGARFLFK